MKHATQHRSPASGRAPQPAATRSQGRAFPGRLVDGWLEAIDPVAAVRGMSSGFSVLVIGSLLVPVVASQLPVMRSIGLTLAAVAGFVVAASKQGTTRAPGRQGATAALGAYFLVLPLVYLATHRVDFAQIGLTVLAAVVVGALAGHILAFVARLGSDA